MHGARVHSVLTPLWNSGYSWQEAVLKAFRLLEHWVWALGEKNPPCKLTNNENN